MYQVQPGQHHFRQPSQHSGPPPAKKPKGNPVITKYPPPPGYRPPVQPQMPYGPQPGWQPSTFGQPVYSGYQQPQYAQQPYQMPLQYHGYPTPPYAQPPHPAAMSTWHTPVSAPQSAPPQAWQNQQNGFAPPEIRRHNSLPFPPSGTLLDGNGDPMPPPDLTANLDDLEDEYDAECYFARHPEQIQPTLSLGVIEWKAPMPGRRALPATFSEAELEAIAPRIPLPSDEESISDYFINAKRDEALLSVRQTEKWKDMKHELIFQEFEAVCSRIVSLSELFDNYRVRYDSAWADGGYRSPTPELSRASTPASEQHDIDTMQIDQRHRSTSIKSTTPNALDDLERALQDPTRRSHSAAPSEAHSRTGSVSSQNLPRFQRPKALPPIRDQKQEDILASLGVTGSPKLVYQTPGPAFGPPPTTAKGKHSRTNSMNSAQGIDAEPDNEATPRPKMPRFDSSRKRSYADSTAGAIDDRIDEEDEEATPKQRRKLARV